MLINSFSRKSNSYKTISAKTFSRNDATRLQKNIIQMAMLFCELFVSIYIIALELGKLV